MTSLYSFFEGKSKEEAFALVGGYYEVEETVAEIDRLQQTLKNKIATLASNTRVPKSLIQEVMENKMKVLSNISYEDLLVSNKEETSVNVKEEVQAKENDLATVTFVSDLHSNHTNVIQENEVALILAEKELNGTDFWINATPAFLYKGTMPILNKMSKQTSSEFQKVRAAYKEEFAGLPYYNAIKTVFGGWSEFMLFLNEQKENGTKKSPIRVTPSLEKCRSKNWYESDLAKLKKELNSEPKSLIANGKFSVPSSLIISEKEVKSLYRKVVKAIVKSKPTQLPWRAVLTPKQVLSMVVYAMDKVGSSSHADISRENLDGFGIPSLTFFVKALGGWKETLKIMNVTHNSVKSSSVEKAIERQSVSVTTTKHSEANIKASHPFSTEVVKPSVNPNNLTGPAFLAYFENGLNLLTDLNDEDAYINNLMDSKLMETVSFPSLNVIESNYADFSDALNAYYLNKFKGFEFNSETGSQLVEEFIKLGKPQNKKEFNKAYFSNGNSKKFVPLNVILTSLSTYDFYFNYVTSCIAEW